MNIDYKPSFLRSIKKITDPAIKEAIEQVIKSICAARTTQDIPELRKLRGYKSGTFYRIKVDDYRIGVIIDNDIVTLAIFMHRKDIYKFFP